MIEPLGESQKLQRGCGWALAIAFGLVLLLVIIGMVTGPNGPTPHETRAVQTQTSDADISESNRKTDSVFDKIKREDFDKRRSSTPDMRRRLAHTVDSAYRANKHDIQCRTSGSKAEGLIYVSSKMDRETAASIIGYLPGDHAIFWEFGFSNVSFSGPSDFRLSFVVPECGDYCHWWEQSQKGISIFDATSAYSLENYIDSRIQSSLIPREANYPSAHISTNSDTMFIELLPEIFDRKNELEFISKSVLSIVKQSAVSKLRIVYHIGTYFDHIYLREVFWNDGSIRVSDNFDNALQMYVLKEAKSQYLSDRLREALSK